MRNYNFTHNGMRINEDYLRPGEWVRRIDAEKAISAEAGKVAEYAKENALLRAAFRAANSIWEQDEKGEGFNALDLRRRTTIAELDAFYRAREGR